MRFASGDRLGAYEILGPLGAGGMGEVFRARDTRLGRDVALKILPEDFARDPDRLMRFDREARTLAVLNHPHIAAIYGVEETPATAASTAGSRALVMELVEGEDLSARIARGPLPLDEARAIARQIADALEAAHETGIIHRDLKPANIKVRGDGTVKVLDFGVAKAVEASTSPATANTAATITSPAVTIPGVILGTAAYMAPEQAKGRPVDRRADIWAFGCVLYEMLTGRRVFAGDDIADTITSVLRDAPDWSQVPATTPAATVRLLRRCLEKDVRQRLPHIGVARLDLDDVEAPAPTLGPASTAPRHRRTALPWAIAATLAIVAGTVALRRAPAAPPTPLDTVRFEIAPPPGERLGHKVALRGTGPAAPHFAVSPDGTQVVFTAFGDGEVRLWLRPLASPEPRLLDGTDDASLPFWSPDGRSVAFFAGGLLKRLALDGTRPITVAPAERGEGGSWGTDGTILYAPTVSGPIFRVSASGGEPEAVTTVPSETLSHTWPSHLPGSTRFVYVATDKQGRRTVRLRSLEPDADDELLQVEARATVAGDTLLFPRDGQLHAQRLDATTGRPLGAPSIVSSNVATNIVTGRAGFHATASGVLLVRPTSSAELSQLTWRARDGRLLGTMVERGALGHVQISPDGARAVVQINATVDNARTSELWIYDLATGTRPRLTVGGTAFHGAPVWSRDGRRVAYLTAPTLSEPIGRHVVIQGVGGAEAPRRLASGFTVGGLTSWTPDERGILVTGVAPSAELRAAGMGGVSLLPVDGGTPTSVLAGNAVAGARFSPDGRWLAYSDLVSGSQDVYLQPFPLNGQKLRVSPSGGELPTWSGNSRELFFVGPGAQSSTRTLFSVSMPVAGSAQAPAPPVRIFDVPLADVISANYLSYSPSPDGQKFLLAEREGGSRTTPGLGVTLNWRALIAQ